MIIALSGCSLSSPGSEDAATLPPEATITPTSTPIFTPTSPPTASPTPTLTLAPTETFTPTPELFVLAGTPIPQALEPITLENADRVSGLAEWHERAVTDIAWTPDGHLLAVSNSEDISLYDVQFRGALRTLYPTNPGVIKIEFSPSGRWLVAGSRRGSEETGYASSLELWSGPNWKPLGILYGSLGGLSDMTFSTDGTQLATAYASHLASQNYVEFWNTLSWTIAVSDTLQTGTVLDVAFSNDGNLLAVSPDRYAIQIWDFEEQTWLHTIHTSFTDGVTHLAFSPDGITLASGHYDGTVNLWDLETGQNVLSMQSDEVVQSLAFNSDGSLLAAGGSYEDYFIRIWSAQTGALLNTLPGHTSGVTQLLFSPDNQYLVSASYDGTIRLWGIRPGTR
jgi:WD40 repeat protein